MSWVGQGLKIQTTLKNTARLSEIISVFASCGFTPWIKKLKLTKFASPIKQHPELTQSALPERLRIAFEHLGPTFIKFGQILATRHDLLPAAFIQSFEKLQDQANIVGFTEIQNILAEELGPDYSARFTHIEAAPLGSASIAQVHRAQLLTGEKIVLKVQKPRSVIMIKEDLRILMLLSQLAHDSIPELQSFRLPDLVAEFAEALSRETEFLLEANNIRKFSDNFKESTYLKVPKVYWEFTSDRVLALEELEGKPLSQSAALKMPGLDLDTCGKHLLTNYLEQVFIHGYFHGDLHPGNVLILKDSQFGLIDFGMMGRLSHKTKLAVIKMLQSLAQEDYESLATEYIHLSPFDERVLPERFAQGLQHLISPYFGLNLKNVNVGELLLSTAQMAAKEGLRIPRELLVFFKSLVGIESVIRKLNPEFDFLKSSLEFASSHQTQELSLTEWRRSLEFLMKDSEHLVKDFPKQFHFLLKKWNSPAHELRLGGRHVEGIKHQINHLGLALFWGLIAASIILAATLFVLFDRGNPHNIVMGLLICLSAVIVTTHFRMRP